MIRYTVIMPAYNVEQYIERAIESVLNQTLTDWELIIVNDGSIDKSGDIADKYSKKDSRIRVIHQKNKGSGYARQAGVDASKGEYICFVDPDDFLDSKALYQNWIYIKTFKPQVIVNGFKLMLDQQRITKITPNLLGYFEKQEFLDNFQKFSNQVNKVVWNKIYKKNFLINNQIKFTNLPVGQDWRFNIDVYDNIETIYISEDLFYNYDSTIEQSSVKRYRSNRLEIELKIINRNEEFLQKWGIRNSKEIMTKDYYNAMLVEFNNIKNSSNIKGNLSKAQIFKKNLVQYNLEKIPKQLKITDFNSINEKIIFLFLRQEMYRILFCIL
ncbi:glycosyltransferase family 2 protein [Aerococcus urinaeequi]|uniref:glycosyltransferase family 2 protein n=1 Tax=Aerococcus urinaeequi TaxID=51665 RepID=UPI003D6B48EE